MDGLMTRCFRYARRGDQTILVGDMPDDRLDQIDLAMLRAERVPNLLPVIIQMTDRTAQAVYAVGRRKPLNEWLRSQESLAEERCLHFILHMVNTCTQMRDYLLIENRCILHPEWIFVQEQLLDAEFVYWPDRERPWDEHRTALDIQQLCLFLTRFGSGKGIAGEVMRWCEDPMFTLDGLRKRLITWLDQYEAKDHATAQVTAKSPAGSRGWWKRWLPYGIRTRQKTPVARVAVHATVPVLNANEKAGDAMLEMITDDQQTKRNRIDRTPFIIGRDHHIADLALNQAALSRIHAEIKRANSGYVIRDLGSSNGTRVNGELLPPYTDIPLSHGDVIEIADLRFRFVLDITDPVV